MDHRRAPRASLSALLLALGLAAAAWPGTVAAQQPNEPTAAPAAKSQPRPEATLSSAADELAGFERRVEQLEKSYLKPAMLESRYKREARFLDAKVAHYMGDYQRASILFVDIVDSEDFRQFDSHREALYLLGDSLFQIRNYRTAKRYLNQLLELGPGPHYTEGARRLLEIALATKNYEDVDRIYARLQGQPNVAEAISYLTGKALYQQGQHEQARQAFARAAKSPEYAAVATYFQGVSYVAEGKLDAGRQLFRSIVEKQQPVAGRDAEVRDLAWVALGRLAYEAGDVERAIDYYARLDRDSPHFDRALWEMTWALVSKEMYEPARRNVELLLWSDPDPAFVPEAKLLRADLALKLEEYEEATAAYKDVLDTFEPVKADMDRFVAKQDDLQGFFTSLVAQELQGAEPAFMPPMVQRWVESDPTMQSASRLIGDLRTVNKDVHESVRLLDEMDARLRSGTAVQSFPRLAEGMSYGIQAESDLIDLRHQLLQVEYEAVKRAMGGPDRAQWQQLSAAIGELREKFEQMPKTRKELGQREEMVLQEYDRLRRTLDRVGYEIDSQKAQLAAIDTYVAREYGRELTAEEKRRIERGKAATRATIAELQEIRGELERELDLARQSVGVGDPVVAAERQLRERYQQTIDEARQFLSRFHGREGADSAALRKLEALRAGLPPLEKRLDGYFATMNRLVDEKVGELRDDLRRERQMIEEHRASIQEVVNASQTGAGVLAYLNFMRARSQFDNIILRGDVGLIDVSWRKKEDMSQRINQLFEDRTTELKLLQEAFEEVR